MKNRIKGGSKDIIVHIITKVLRSIIGVACLYFGWNYLLPWGLKEINIIIPHITFVRSIIVYFALQFISVPIVFYQDDVFKITRENQLAEYVSHIRQNNQYKDNN